MLILSIVVAWKIRFPLRRFTASQGKENHPVSSDPTHSTDDAIGQKIDLPQRKSEKIFGTYYQCRKEAKDF